MHGQSKRRYIRSAWEDKQVCILEGFNLYIIYVTESKGESEQDH